MAIQQKQIKEGRRVRYESRAHQGTGKIVGTHQGKTGMWINVHDRTRNATMALRAGQLTAI